MLTSVIQPQTSLVVDWSSSMNEPEASIICEYDTSKTPFRIYSPMFNRWKETGYFSVEDLEKNGADIIWELKNEK